MKNLSLGKGLSALLKEEVLPLSKDELVKLIDIEKIEAGSYQPRKFFEYEKLKELADSIRSSGLLQPIIVTRHEDKYKIVAGERRWRACKIAGLNDIPVIIKALTDKEILEVGLIENIQREGLNVIEEAEGFERLIKEFDYTQERLAEMLGKSRSHIANLLRLNQLPASIKDKLISNQLTMGHARCLIGHPEAERLANQIIARDLSVRQTELLVKNWSMREDKDGYSRSKEEPQICNQELHVLSEALSEKFGVKVEIQTSSNGMGKVIFHYATFQQLDSILARL